MEVRCGDDFDHPFFIAAASLNKLPFSFDLFFLLSFATSQFGGKKFRCNHKKRIVML